MDEKWLITDAFVETVSALEVFAEGLERAMTDPHTGGSGRFLLYIAAYKA